MPKPSANVSTILTSKYQLNITKIKEIWQVNIDNKYLLKEIYYLKIINFN